MNSEPRIAARPDIARILLALLAVFGLVCFLYPSRLPIAWLWYDHADTLIMEQIARDLWRGGSLLDWRLTQAPYLFPDIALAVVLAAVLPLGTGAVWVHAIYGVTGAWGWWRLGRSLGATVDTAILAPLAYTALFLASPISPSLGSTLAVYFGLPFHHSAMAAMTPFALLALVALWRSLQPDARVRFASVLASVTLLFLLAISDGSFAIGLLAPVAGVFVVTLFRPARLRDVGRRPAVATFIVLIAILMVLSIWAGEMLVFDSREWFARWVIRRFVSDFPQPTLNSIRAFARYPFESWFTAALIAAWFIALAFAAARLCVFLFGRKALTSGYQADKGEELILLATVVGGLVVIVEQVLVGLFVFPANSRQFAGFLISALALTPLLLSRRQIAWPRFVVPLAAACLLGLYWFKLQHLPREAYQQKYVDVVRCLDKEFPQGADFAADFWLKVPIEFWSQARFRGVASTPSSPGPFTNGQNVTQMRRVRPTLAIVTPDYARQFLDAYGAPARTVECPAGVTALDYSNSPTFIERHVAIAKAAQ